MSYKKIEDIQYLYENLNSYDQDVIELLETVEGQLRESGYSERAVDCFIETADIHNFKSIIESSSLDEGVKGKFIKELGKKGLNFIKTQGKRLKDAAGKAGGKVKDVAKKNPKTTAVVGTTGVVGTALATSGDVDDKKETGDDKKIKLKDPGVFTPKVKKDEKIETPKDTKPKKNVPDGAARVAAGALDQATGNLFDFDQRSGGGYLKKGAKALGRIAGGVADAATGNLTDFDKKGGKTFGVPRVAAGALDKLTGDRTDFDKKGVSKLNKGQRDAQQALLDKQKKELTKPKEETPKAPKEIKKPVVVPGSEKIIKAKWANPSGKQLPKARTIGFDKGQVNPNSARGQMIARNKEMFGGDKIEKLRDKDAAFQASKKSGSNYSKNDFIKDFPKSNAAKDSRKNKRVTSVMDMESYDAFDIVLGYLKETQQADSLDEALYIMMEMDSSTIQGIVKDFEMITEEEADRMKDERLEKYGIGHDGSDRKAGSGGSSDSKRPKGKTVLQKETEKKYGKGKSAIDIVRAKYGNNAMITNSRVKKKKENKES
tara:strand:- start:514 stop:2145 length:1632 start_codon:yes stop_codon:yes gene_type:complete